jgi:hypothetical protein
MIEYNTPPADAAAPSVSPADWKERGRLSLEQQWSLAQDLLTLGRRVLSRSAGQTQRPTSLAQVERILQLATRLARLSTDLAAQSANAREECPKCCAARLEREAALHRIYGEDAEPPAPSAPSPMENIVPTACPSHLV